MIYADNYVFNTTTDVVTQQIFRGNSINDPDFTGVGHQAMGHDDWKTMYAKYLVNASKIEVWFLGAASAATSILNVGIVPVTTSTALSASDVDVFNENPYARQKIVNGASAQGWSKITSYMSTSKMYGMRIGNDDQFTANFDANPGYEWFWQVYAGSVDESSDVYCMLKVKITYYVKCFKRVPRTGVE